MTARLSLSVPRQPSAKRRCAYASTASVRYPSWRKDNWSGSLRVVISWRQCLPETANEAPVSFPWPAVFRLVIALKARGRSPSTKLTPSSTKRKRSTAKDRAYKHRDSRHHKATADHPIDSFLIPVARVRHVFC